MAMALPRMRDTNLLGGPRPSPGGAGRSSSLAAAVAGGRREFSGLAAAGGSALAPSPLNSRAASRVEPRGGRGGALAPLPGDVGAGDHGGLDAERSRYPSAGGFAAGTAGTGAGGPLLSPMLARSNGQSTPGAGGPAGGTLRASDRLAAIEDALDDRRRGPRRRPGAGAGAGSDGEGSYAASGFGGAALDDDGTHERGRGSAFSLSGLGRRSGPGAGAAGGAGSPAGRRLPHLSPIASETGGGRGALRDDDPDAGDDAGGAAIRHHHHHHHHHAHHRDAIADSSSHGSDGGDDAPHDGRGGFPTAAVASLGATVNLRSLGGGTSGTGASGSGAAAPSFGGARALSESSAATVEDGGGLYGAHTPTRQPGRGAGGAMGPGGPGGGGAASLFPALLPPITTPSVTIPSADCREASIPHPSCPGIVGVAGISLRGHNPMVRKINQDAMVMVEHAATASLLVAVFDGHGVQGHDVSGFVARNFVSRLLQDRRFVELPHASASTSTSTSSTSSGGLAASMTSGAGAGAGAGEGDRGGTGAATSPSGSAAPGFAPTDPDMCEVLTDALMGAEASLLQESSIDTSLSGCTAVAGIIRGHKVWVIGVGDSRLIIGNGPPAPGSHAAAYFASLGVGGAGGIGGGTGGLGALSRGLHAHLELADPVTIDHKPDLPAEKRRILAAGGRVMATRNRLAPHLVGPPRVWLRDVPAPGLAMSRSLGDMVAKVAGVVSTPDKITRILGPASRCLVLASDGLWDFVSNAEVSSITQRARSAQVAADTLMRVARSRWIERTGGSDDITIVVVTFDIVS